MLGTHSNCSSTEGRVIGQKEGKNFRVRIFIKFITGPLAMLFFFSSCTPTNEQLMEKAYNYSKQKKFDKAIEVYTDIIRNNRRLQLAYYNRGLNYREIKNYNKALLDFNMVMSLQTYGEAIITFNPNTPLADDEARAQVPYFDALYQRAQVKFFMDSLRSSFIDFQTLINNNYEEVSNCLLWQGVLWVKAGKTQKACEYFKKAQQLALTDDDKKEADNMMQAYCKHPHQ